MSAGAEDVMPEVGSIWRERRRQYARRKVRVLGMTDTPNPYVLIETVTTTSGQPPKRPVQTAVRGSLWRSTFEEVR